MEHKLIGIPPCPQCGSRWNTYRKTLESFLCRRCGNTWGKYDERTI